MFDDSSFFKAALAENQSRADAQLPVRFEWFDQEDQEETKKCGYPRYKRIQIIRTLIPGSKEERVDKVREEHKHRFPRAWAAFQAGEEGVVDGTPLKEYPGLSRDDISTAVHFHVVSVEQLASVSDEQAGNMGHGWRDRAKGAKAWLASRKAAKPMAELNAQLQAERDEKELMKERLTALEAALSAQGKEIPETPKPKAKRIRKPKTGTKPHEPSVI